MTEKSSKNSKAKSPRPLKKSPKKRLITPQTELGRTLAGALLLIRDGLDREICQCDGYDVAEKWCPLCAIKGSARQDGRPEIGPAAEAAIANVVEDEDFTADDSIEVRSALIHWIESASDEEVEETFVEAIDIAEAG